MLTDLGQVIEVGRAAKAEDREIYLSIKTCIIPRLDVVYAELGSFHAVTPGVYGAQTALYYQVGYTRQSLQFLVDDRIPEQSAAVAAAKVYALKTNEAFATIVEQARRPASTIL